MLRLTFLVQQQSAHERQMYASICRRHLVPRPIYNTETSWYDLQCLSDEANAADLTRLAAAMKVTYTVDDV